MYAPLIKPAFLAACVMTVGAATAQAIAAPITFSTQPASTDFPTVTGAGNTGQQSLTSVSRDGLTLTVAASGGLGTIAGSTDGNDGFGVAGNSSYDINSNESLTLTFNETVNIEQITFDVFSFDDEVRIEVPSLSISTTVGGNSSFDPEVEGISTGGNASGPFTVNFAADTFKLNAGETIVISQGAGSANGILLDGITVNPVPEPSSMALVACGLASFICRRRVAPGVSE